MEQSSASFTKVNVSEKGSNVSVRYPLCGCMTWPAVYQVCAFVINVIVVEFGHLLRLLGPSFCGFGHKRLMVAHLAHHYGFGAVLLHYRVSGGRKLCGTNGVVAVKLGNWHNHFFSDKG